jgi:cell division septation protein DedD
MGNYFVHLTKFSYPMKKINSIWSGFALTFLTISAAGQEVKISMDHPDQVNAGQAFEVKVTINKGNLTDYSRFSQDLPLGLTATNVNSPNADFSFDTQRIRIIWLKLPEEPEVSVIYSIQVDERLKGKFVLGGVFAYVVEEERKFLNFEKSKEITILPNPNVDPALVVDIKDFKGGAAVVPLIVEDVEEEPYAMAIRQKPVLLPSGGYMIRLLVQNPSGSKYAKIEETIPSGYLFESVDPHDGIESFASSTVKFIWMKLPSEPEFEVAYRLVPKRDEPQGAMAIEGVLTYSVGNENKIVDVKEVDVALETLSPDQKRTLLLTGAVPAGAKKATETAARVQPEPVAKETVKAPVTTVEPVPTAERTIVNTRVLQAGSGIIFRVQLSANRKAFDARNFFRKAGVDQEVFVEEHGGLYKYTAGSYTNYSQAQAYRDKLEALSQVSGAFVVAYQNGKRVPVSTVR